MRKPHLLFLFSLFAIAAIPACALDTGDELAEWGAAVTTVEGFEAGSKGSYAAADVSLGSGTWNFDDALIGTLAGDAKVGNKSARLRNSGRITMKFDVADGIGAVTVRHASYGSDASASFGLYRSLDGGSSWTKVGATVTTQTGSLATATFAVNQAGPIRLQLRKLDGGSGRINLDELNITTIGDGGGGDDDDDGGGDPTPPTTPGSGISVHTTMGLPAPASTSSTTNYLSVKSQYVLAYDSSRKVPRWVSWELNSSYLGTASRQDNYRTDSTLPSGMPQASLGDYSGSNYDRGHMCPSGDRTKTTTANGQTFYLTNMLPQAGNNNGGPWAKLETYSRTLATSGKELFVIAGGAFSANPPTIGNGVAVPSSTWKVIVVLNQVGQGPSAVTTSTRVIAVLMPNDDDDISASDDWKSYRVSVDSLESLTKLDFLSDVPASVQAVIEAKVDNQ